MRALSLAILALCGCSAARPALDLAPDLDVAPRVLEKAGAVDRDLPAGQEDRALVRALLAFAGRSAEGADEALLASRFGQGDVGLSFETRLDGEPAYHELTAGLVGLAFSDFSRCFDPAADWGRNLAGWRGGGLAVDLRDGQGRPILQRERMVLSMPWYAVGAPDMDMSKYEVIGRGPGSVTVSWFVAGSHNASVFQDEGYLAFQAVTLGGREATLVLFNSLHRIDHGWGGALLPKGARASLSMRALRDTFLGHLEQYREVLAERGCPPGG